MAKLESLSLSFELPEWKASDFDGFKRSSGRLKELSKKAGQSSDKFRKAYEYFCQLGLSGQQGLIEQSVKTNTEARAIVHLWLHKKTFLQCFPITSERLRLLKGTRTRLSSLTLLGLMELYFESFDLLKEKETVLGGFIATELSNQKFKYADKHFHLSEASKQLFSLNGPKWLVDERKIRKWDLERVINHYSLSSYENSRFLKVTRSHYYLSELDDLKPEDITNPILSELSRSDVYKAPYDDGLLIGHEIIKRLVDKVTGNNVPDHWQALILSIAGDPRVPKGSKNYEKWWSLLGDSVITKVRGWLSKLDLKIFLEALEHSAKDGNQTEIERMFLSRKAFMEGLLAQELVVDSRLFLSRSADAYMKRAYKEDELPEYVLSGDRVTSIIYLNVSGVHMVEGSHSFTLKLMDKLPNRPAITNFGVTKFNIDDFRSWISNQYRHQYGDQGLAEIRHDALVWQHKAIEFFNERGLNIDKQKVLSSGNYRAYKQKYGV